MSSSTVQLYSTQPLPYPLLSALSQVAQTFNRTFELLPLSQLPPPNKGHLKEQMLRNELIGLTPQLTSCLDFIRLAENNPRRFGHELPALRQERDALELRRAEIEQQLTLQKGGPWDV